MSERITFDDIIDRVLVFCWRHRFAIGMTASVLGGFCYGRSTQKDENKKIEEENEHKKQIEEWNRKRAEYEADPKNHVCRNGIVEDDWWAEVCWDEEKECVCTDNANIIVNNISEEELGELGQALKERAAKGGCGCMEPDLLNDILSNAQYSLMICATRNIDEEEEKANSQK